MWAHTLILSLLAVPDRNTSLKISYWRLSSDLVSFLSFVHRCKARAELSYVHLPRLPTSQALNEWNPIPEKGSLASFASPPGLYSRFTVFGCISFLCLCLILILASYFNYLTPLPPAPTSSDELYSFFAITPGLCFFYIWWYLSRGLKRLRGRKRMKDDFL